MRRRFAISMLTLVAAVLWLLARREVPLGTAGHETREVGAESAAAKMPVLATAPARRTPRDQPAPRAALPLIDRAVAPSAPVSVAAVIPLRVDIVDAATGDPVLASWISRTVGIQS